MVPHSNQVPPSERRRRYLSGGTLSLRRNADQWWRYDWTTMALRQSGLGFLSAGIDPSGGAKTMMVKTSDESTSRAALAVSPRLLVRHD